MAAPDVSIVIVSYNVRELLRACLRSIPESNRPAIAYEVIVVDNASYDRSADMVAREFPDVMLLRNQENVGFARASNQGAAVSKGRYVLLLNPDTEVLPGCLARLVAFADTHPDAGVVGCAHLSPDGRPVPSFARGYLFPKPLYSNRIELIRNGWVSGACMLLSRDACEKVGWLDESFFFGCEDVELCWRMSKVGWHVYYLPDARIIHHGGASSRVNPRVFLENVKNRRAMVRMHAPRWIYALWSFVVSFEEALYRAKFRAMAAEPRTPRKTVHP